MASDGKGCRDLRPLIRSRCKGVLKKIMNGKKNYRVLPRRNLEVIGAVGANFQPFSFGGSQVAQAHYECPERHYPT